MAHINISCSCSLCVKHLDVKRNNCAINCSVSRLHSDQSQQGMKPRFSTQSHFRWNNNNKKNNRVYMPNIRPVWKLLCLKVLFSSCSLFISCQGSTHSFYKASSYDKYRANTTDKNRERDHKPADQEMKQRGTRLHCTKSSTNPENSNSKFTKFLSQPRTSHRSIVQDKEPKNK